MNRAMQRVTPLFLQMKSARKVHGGSGGYLEKRKGKISFAMNYSQVHSFIPRVKPCNEYPKSLTADVSYEAFALQKLCKIMHMVIHTRMHVETLQNHA